MTVGLAAVGDVTAFVVIAVRWASPPEQPATRTASTATAANREKWAKLVMDV